MGLDMYVYSTKSQKDVEDIHKLKKLNELCYWRKHPNLHGWMEEVYQSRTDDWDTSFNGVYLELFESNLDDLEEAVQKEELPETSGCFFGEDNGEEKEEDLEQIGKMREALKKGYRLFYCSSW